MVDHGTEALVFVQPREVFGGELGVSARSISRIDGSKSRACAAVDGGETSSDRVGLVWFGLRWDGWGWFGMGGVGLGKVG